MALICRTTRTWITRQVLDPVRRWVNRRRRTCRERRRWWQRLFCWFVTILVQIVEWVVRNIVVPILNTICVFVTWAIGAMMLPFAVAIDVAAGTTTAQWVRDWFITPTRITFVSIEDDPNDPTSRLYTFTCNCNGSTLVVSAQNDTQAEAMATRGCRDRC